MIQVGTTLKVIDNSGAREVYCIGVLAGYRQRYAKVGEYITVAVKKLRTRRRTAVKIKKGEIAKALIIRTKTPINNDAYGSISFFENSVVLLTNQKKVLGSRIFGALPKQLRFTKHMRLAFLAKGLIK
jgi:large subunit ribosomal protein L14